MSILLNATPTGHPEMIASGVLILLTMAAPIVLWKAGVFRAGSIGGVPRLSPREPGWTLAVLFFAGVSTFLLVQVGFTSLLVVQRKAAGVQAPLTADHFSTGQWVFLTTVPALVASLVLLAGNALLRRPGGLRSIGLSLDLLPAGIGKGLLAMVVILPIMGWSSLALEALYQRVGYQHPDEHDLLRIIFATEHPAYWWLLLSAIIGVAPLAEELLFRGHLQTLVRRTLDWMSGQTPEPVLPVSLDESSDPAPGAEAPAMPVAPVAPSPMRAWTAVIVTSLLFSLVHPTWTAPLIFLLSLCLGYVYERTGNLWCTIVMHATFNGLSTLFYFYQTR